MASAEQQPDAYTLVEAAKRLRLGRNKTLELVHSGRLRHVRVGRRIIIPRSAILQFLTEFNEEPK